jgi:hypothetical protein
MRFVAFLSCFQHVFHGFYGHFRPLFRVIFARFGAQFDTLKRAVLAAILPVLSVADIFIRTGSASSSIAVPAASPNDMPLLAEIVRVPCLVGTDVSTEITVTEDIVSAVSSAQVTVAELIVSAVVSIGPKSAYRKSVSSTCLQIVPSKSTHVVI